MNIWNFISIIICVIIILPIFLIIFNMNIESENWNHIKENLVIRYVSSTLYLIVGVGFLSTIIGVGCAWFVTCHSFYGRKFMEWILILPLTIPTYIVAYSYYDILETLNPIFNWSRKSIGIEETMILENFFVYLIVIFLFSFVLYPYIYLSVRASLLIQGSRFIEAANTLGVPGDKIFKKVILPIIRPSIIAGLSLVVMETLNDYAAVEYFGISTLTIGIFRSWFGMHDIGSALKLSSYLIVFIFAILSFERLYTKRKKYNNISGSNNKFKRIELGNTATILVLIFCSTPFVFGCLIPIGRLSTWLLRSTFNFDSINLLLTSLNTILISIVSCFLITLIAFIIIFCRNYFDSKVLKKISGLAILGYSMPGAIIAIGVLKLNDTINGIYPIMLVGSIIGLIFAYLVRFLAVAWQPIESSMRKHCFSINQASRTLNVKATGALIRINLPIMKKPLLLTSLIVFIDVSKELPLTLILRPFNFDTLATLTYDLISQAQFFESSLPSLLIIFISFPAIFIINRQVNTE